jgi:hypothetical protein
MATALDALDATTQKRIIPYLMDSAAQSNVIAQALFPNIILMDGGSFVEQPVMLSLPTSAVIAYSGPEVFPDNFQELEKGAVFDWKFYGIKIDFTGPDLAKNSGVAAAINILRTRAQAAEIAIKQVIGTDLYGDGTGSAGKAVLGFKAAIDDGSNYDSYGGVSRASFTVWKAIRLGNGGTARALTTGLIDTAVQNAMLDTDMPNLFVGSAGLLTKFNQLMQPMQRIASDEVGSQGFKQVAYRGYPVIYDGQLPTTPRETMYCFNTRYIQLYGLRGKFFSWKRFQDIANQDVISGKITISLCLVVSRPASEAVIVDLDSTL